MQLEKRKYLRVTIKQLTSIIRQDGVYELIKQSPKATNNLINLKDISTGGLRIASTKEEFKKGVSCNLKMQKIKNLDSRTIKCEVTRASFEDGDYAYDIGLRFVPQNTDYLKKLVEIINCF